MKYIRTKNGEVFIKHFDKSRNRYYWESQEHTTKLTHMSYKEFLKYFGGLDKKSDNLKELCDKYVYIRPNGFHESYDNLSDDDLDYIREGWIIYGAVWTDKGLIYIAKVNNKGELELL